MTEHLPKFHVNVTEKKFSNENADESCEIGRNIMFSEQGLVSYCIANWEPVVYDSLVVAAAVQFCDHVMKRPEKGWGRQFDLTIPVHDIDKWESRCVSMTLRDALNFLTGDRWKINFVKRKKHVEQPKQKHFQLPDNLQFVMSFSDGLDSHVAWRLAEAQYRDKVIRVRLGYGGLSNGYYNKSKQPFAALPYRVKYTPFSSKEVSGRSRGFKFSLLSALAAYLSRTHKIIVPESGQGALGCSLISVGYAYPDYRSHPRFMDRMEKFINALFDYPIHYHFPHIWHTKGETLGAYLNECVDDPPWKKTRSCWQDSRQVSVSGCQRQCGICAACLLRRMSIHAAGKSEDPEVYVWEHLGTQRYEDGAASSFRKKQPEGALYEYAIAGVLHLQHLAELSEHLEDCVSFETEVFFLSRYFDLDGAETRQKLLRMLRQHRDEWSDFVESLGAASFISQWAKGRR